MSKQDNRFIIDQSSRLKNRQKYSAVGITLFFWGVFLYLWHPLISLVAWWAGFKLFYNRMILLGGYEAFVEIAIFYLLAAIILGGGLILWAKTNQWRFRNKNNRKTKTVHNSRNIGEFFDVDRSVLEQHIDSKYVNLEFDEQGKVVKLES